MLDHGVHVANIPQIFHTRIASGRTLVDLSRICDLYGANARVNGIKGLSDHFIGEIFVVFANFKDELVDGLPRRLLLARGFTTEETVLPQELHLPLRHLRSQVEIRQQLSTPLNSQLILFIENIPKQNFRHGRHSLLLHAKFSHKHRQNPKILRSDIGESDVLEHLRNVEILM